MTGRRFAALLLLLAFCRAVLAGQPAMLTPGKHLVVDSRVIGETSHVRLALGRVQKERLNPLFQADKPWENSLNNLYPNVAYDPEEAGFKLWYKDMLCDPACIQKMGSPRIIAHVGWFLLYATSRDGLTWTKPRLGLIPFDGATDNNIVARDTANTGVFKDLHDPNPARRYKMVHDEGRGHLRVRFSADGIHWGEALTPAIAGGVGDTHNNAFYDPHSGKYVLITRLFEGERKVARSESRDFLNWTDAKVVLESLPGEKGRRQTYCMPAFPYANIYFGYLMLINTPGDSTVDCELAWSPDSLSWHRVNPGTSFIPRGPEGSYDSGCIYAAAGSAIARDGQLLIFYGGSKEKHVGCKRHCLLCLARLRLDGFAGYEPDTPGGRGSLVTQPLRCTGEPLRISADAKGGAVRVRVLDVPGFEAKSRPVKADVTDGEVKWSHGRRFASLKGKVVRLEFELDSATLYAFSGLELTAGQ